MIETYEHYLVHLNLLLKYTKGKYSLFDYLFSDQNGSWRLTKMQQLETTVFIILVTGAAINAAMRIGNIQKDDLDSYLVTLGEVSLDRVPHKLPGHSM